MADVCPDCGRPKAENGTDWNIGFQSAHPDEVAPECGAWLPSYWSDEALPDCHLATFAHQRDRIRALESQLAAALKVVEAADRMRTHGSLQNYNTYDAARAELRKVTDG